MNIVDQERRVVGVVLEPIHPERLVVADDVGHVLGEDPALARRDDQLAVGDVADALEHGPFARLGRTRRRSPASATSARSVAGVSAWTTAGSSSPSAARSEAR